DPDRRRLVDVDRGGERVAAGRELQVVRDARVVVAAAPVEAAEALQVGAEGNGVELGRRAPHAPALVPRALGGHQRAPELARAERVIAAEDERPEPPLAPRLQHFELYGERGARAEERDEQREPGARRHAPW